MSIPKYGGDGFGDRFGYGSNTYNLGNFFPIAAVYENGSWDKHPYDEKGDAFYSETSNFDVEITAPEEQVIATSGYADRQGASKGKQVLAVRAYSVRDFAFVSSDMFKIEEAMVNGTLVKSYAMSSKKAKKVLEFSTEAIRIFNKNYGKYPYSNCSIVQSDIGGGKEYPNLVMIESNDDYYVLIYNKGTMMYKDLNDQLGDEKFGKLLRTLFEKYKYKIISGMNYNVKLVSVLIYNGYVNIEDTEIH